MDGWNSFSKVFLEWQYSLKSFHYCRWIFSIVLNCLSIGRRAILFFKWGVYLLTGKSIVASGYSAFSIYRVYISFVTHICECVWKIFPYKTSCQLTSLPSKEMHEGSPVPSTVHKWSQNMPDTSTAILFWLHILSQSLCCTEKIAKLGYSVPTHTPSLSNYEHSSAVSHTVYHCFMVLISRLTPNLSENQTVL